MHKIKTGTLTARNNWKVCCKGQCIFIYEFSLPLLCDDLRWKELPYIANKLNNPGFSDRELSRKL